MKHVFSDKVVIVTGAAMGIGRAIALAFAHKGAKVIVSDIVDSSETCSAIQKQGGDCWELKCDISKESDVQKLMEKTVEKYGSIDFAINNAGIEGATSLTHECSFENWDRILNVNLRGTWLCMKHELNQMISKRKGVIVNIASTAGLVGVVGMPAYTASKHGVVGLTKVAALEYVKQGIRINAVCPGAIKTPMIERLVGNSKEAEEAISAQEPIGRIGRPEEIAGMVTWLCSEEASFVIGQAIAVDGGLVAQ